MAGAAIIGIVSAVLRLTEVGAPIRYLAVGEKFVLKAAEKGSGQVLVSKAQEWFEGFNGQIVGLIAFVALAVLCYLLARKGAAADLAEARAAAEAEAADKK
jgi:hypothetical protein